MQNKSRHIPCKLYKSFWSYAPWNFVPVYRNVEDGGLQNGEIYLFISQMLIFNSTSVVSMKLPVGVHVQNTPVLNFEYCAAVVMWILYRSRELSPALNSNGLSVYNK